MSLSGHRIDTNVEERNIAIVLAGGTKGPDGYAGPAAAPDHQMRQNSLAILEGWPPVSKAAARTSRSSPAGCGKVVCSTVSSFDQGCG